MGRMTSNQKKVIQALQNKGCCFIAASAEDHWQRGKEYYIDSRVPVGERLRRMFDKGNREAQGEG